VASREQKRGLGAVHREHQEKASSDVGVSRLTKLREGESLRFKGVKKGKGLREQDKAVLFAQ